ncbi:MAG: serine/threonine protein kinase [Verrucomicrobium sp.]|nr:serine/threonine-protein kinase [Verrucomicrobium sp.]
MPSSTPQSSSSSGPNWKAPTPSALQSLLQGYEVIELIGKGGMGAVYKARQISLDRLVAIKVLPPDLWSDEEDYDQRFRNEARLMARLMHPGMIAVFDFGEMKGGLLYIVMEYVEGTDVAQMLVRQDKLEPLHAISIAAHVCDTLAYAHEHGIVHRDIKPANVMVDMEGRVKVADFGLAKHSTQDADEAHNTKTMGTPDYVSPESLLLGVVVDGRADLYSLGVMLYEMLTGSVPRALHRPPSEVVPTLDKRLDAIVKRAMQAGPEARYQKAADFRQDLNHILTVPAAKAQPSRPARGASPARTGRGMPVIPAPASSGPKASGVPWGLIGIGLVLAGGAAYFALHQGNGPSTPVDSPGAAVVPAAVAPSDNAASPEAAMPNAPASLESTSAAPAPSPEAAPGQAPPEVTVRLGELDASYQSAIQRDVTLVQETALRDLHGKYLSALDRAMLAASSSGNNQEVAALNSEKARLAAAEPLPAGDDAATSPGLKELRRIYRSSRTPIDAKAAQTHQELQQKYLQVLGSYQQELQTAGQLAGAAAVSAKADVVRAAVIEVPSSASPEMAATPGAPATAPAPSNAPLTGEEAKLQQFLGSTSWRWRSQSDEQLDFTPDGKVYCPGWEEQNFGVVWQVLGRRHVRITITGRANNTEANLFFSEDLTSYTGTDFSGRPFRFAGSRIQVVQATPAVLNQDTPFAGRITFPLGEYRLKHRLVLGAPDPAEPKTKAAGRLTSLPGTRFVGGEAFIDKGAWNSTGTLFSGIYISAEWGTDFFATNCLFSNSRLSKGGGWWGDYFSSRWKFENCVVAGSFIAPWKVIDIGVRINRCTFHEVDFPSILYRKDAGKEVTKSWFSITNCRFVNCKIPESLLIATKDCVFEGCTFGAPETDLLIETPVKTTIYVTDRRVAPVTGPKREIEVLDATRIPQPAGSTLRYGKNGMTLSFQ